MRPTDGIIRAVTLALAVSVAGAASAAPADDPQGADREEIIITHQRLGPLSDWAQMQAHTAEYQRLKAKFDPTTGSSHVDSWASDRALAAPKGSGSDFMQESADTPTPPAVQAIKDAVVPP